MNKACNTCGVLKDLSEYNRRVSGRDGHDPRCRACKNVKRKGWLSTLSSNHREARLVARRQDNLVRRFGLSQAAYDALLLRQEGRCAICGGVDATRRLAVDHDHSTGAVRGLLCSSCNTGVGLLKESPLLMLSAMSYLERACPSP